MVYHDDGLLSKHNNLECIWYLRGGVLRSTNLRDGVDLLELSFQVCSVDQLRMPCALASVSAMGVRWLYGKPEPGMGHRTIKMLWNDRLRLGTE